MTQPLSIKNKLAGNPNSKPQFAVQVKNKSGEDVDLADPRATRAMVALMDMNAVLGGAASHYGGPAAFAELMSATHGIIFAEAQKANKSWYDMFHVINDAGHCENGLYALKANYGFAGLKIQDLKGFRSIQSKLTGHGESHLFPEAVLMSNGPLGSSLPQAQGLAMADALAAHSRVTIAAISDGASMEGEARESFAAIPGLAKAGKMSPFVMIISDNNTKLTGRIDKESFSMEPTFAALHTLGWKVLQLDDGHDLQKCYDIITLAIDEARANPKIPIAIHAKTIKGIGTKKTAESSSGAHGFPLKSPTEMKAFVAEIFDGEKYPEIFDQWTEELIALEKQIKEKNAAAPKPVFGTAPDEKIQTGVSAAMVKCRKENLPVVSITSDLPGSTGVAGFRKEFPTDSFDVGVAESNMISVAAGFSKMGYIPVVDTFAQFGVTKGALPLTMASISEAPMICIFSHTGFQDAADGASHQGLTYLSMTASIPNCDVYCLTCTEEAQALTEQAIRKFASDRLAGVAPRTSIFFLGRENFPKTYKAGQQYKLGEAQILWDNTSGFEKNVTIIASGSMVVQAFAAIPQLESKKMGCIIVNPSIHNRPDLKAISQAIEKTKGRHIFIEDHQMIGGLAHLIGGELYKKNSQIKVRALGVDEEFGQSAYNAIELYEKHQIDSGAIVRSAIELI